MISAFLHSAPLALVIAATPTRVIIAVLLLFTSRPRATSGCFAAGWCAGVLLVTAVAAVFGSFIEVSVGTPIWLSWVKVLLGVVLAGVAVRHWRARGEAQEPSWMRAVEKTSPFSAFRLGALLTAANPKVVVLAFAGGVDIGAAAVGPVQTTASVVEFAVLASLTIAMPWLLYTVFGDRVLDPLERARDWLTAHDRVIVSGVLALVGVLLVADGLLTL